LAHSGQLGEVLGSLRRITQAIRLSSTSAQKTLGVTGAQLFVLQQLAELPEASIGEIVERTLTDQSSVSVVVSRLVRAGHVQRRRSARDGRRIELTLAPSGRALLRRSPPAAQAGLVSALRRVPATKLSVVADVLGSVARDMGATFAKPAMFLEPPAAGRPKRPGRRRTAGGRR
jgi:DNA-binding MarR family transcriptional regulator